MKFLLKSILLFIFFTFLLVISLYGSVTPASTPSATVGPLQLAAHDDGLVFYQNFQGRFYALSPFNDYQINQDGSRSSFISQKEIFNKQYYNTLGQSHFQDIISSIQQYVSQVEPSITFFTQKTMAYKTVINKNAVTVERTVKFPDDNTVKRILGSTLSFNSEDFVYDSQGNMYTFQLDEDRQLFERLYNIQLKNIADDLRVPVKGNTVYLFNRFITGVLVVTAKPNQTIYINRNDKLIEIQEAVAPQNGVYQTSIQLHVAKNPQEALKIK